MSETSFKRIPERVFDDLAEFVRARASDIESDMENFGLLRSVLLYVDYMEENE